MDSYRDILPAPFLIWPEFFGNFKKGAIFVSGFQNVFNYFIAGYLDEQFPQISGFFIFKKGTKILGGTLWEIQNSSE